MLHSGTLSLTVVAFALMSVPFPYVSRAQFLSYYVSASLYDLAHRKAHRHANRTLGISLPQPQLLLGERIKTIMNIL